MTCPMDNARNAAIPLATPTAFHVDTTSHPNTPAKLANGKRTATMTKRLSPTKWEERTAIASTTNDGVGGWMKSANT
jgi:hypothetical protein